MITLISSSSRKDGNCEVIANILSQNIQCKRYFLNDFEVKKIKDNRHCKSLNSYEDDYYMIIEDLLESNIVILLTPLYWYGMSTNLKIFIDRWTESLRDTRFKNFNETIKKIQFIIVIIGGDNPKEKSKPLQNQFELIFEFLNIKNYMFLVGHGNRPNDINNDKEMIYEVKKLNHLLREEL